MGFPGRRPEVTTAQESNDEQEQPAENAEGPQSLEDIGRQRIQTARLRLESMRTSAGRFFGDLVRRTGQGLEKGAYYAAASPEALGRGASAVVRGVEAGAAAAGRGTQAAARGVERGGAWATGKTMEYSKRVADTFSAARDAAIEKGHSAYATVESKVREAKAWAANKKEGITQSFRARVEQMRENTRIKKLLDIEKRVAAHNAEIDRLEALRQQLSNASRQQVAA